MIDFSRELDMRNGVLKRSFIAEFEDGDLVKVNTSRFLSLDIQEVGAINYSVTPINFQGEIEFSPYLDAGIINEDSNYDEFFWEILEQKETDEEAYILSKTLKTGFELE